MAWKFTNNSPIYMQIMDEIKLQIAKGVLKPGEQVPPVRELALTAGVNPNTMQKALYELEREGVLYTQRTSGRFVSEMYSGESSIKESICRQYIEAYVGGMNELGYSKEDMVSKLDYYLREENTDV